MAYITLTEAGQNCAGGREQALKEIREAVDRTVTSYKKLRGGVEVLDEIPKTTSGKILRRLLPARLARGRSSNL